MYYAQIIFSGFNRRVHRSPGHQRPSPGHQRPRPGGSPRYDFHLVSALQRCCKYSKMIAFHGPTVFCELSKATFIPMYCAIVWPHLEYAMEANAPTMRADTNQLERVQRLATRLASPTQPLLDGTQTPPSRPYHGFQNFQK